MPSSDINVAYARAVASGALLAVSGGSAPSVSEPFLEADRIVCHVLDLPRAAVHAHPEMPVPRDKLALVTELALRRAAGEPLAYLLGEALFCGRTFAINGGALIPRTETEMLTSMAGDYLKSLPGAPVFADWCAGSGCIAITLLEECPSGFAYAVDSSGDALELARRNAAARGVGDRVKFLLLGDPSEAEELIAPESLDMIVSNPPYIPTADIEGLEIQVRDYEPMEALDGGADGLDVCRLLLPVLPRYMRRGAPLFMETGGGDQVGRIKSLAEAISRNLEYCGVLPDHRSIERFMRWRKSG